jgi:large subunit ribosomal protein L4
MKVGVLDIHGKKKGSLELDSFVFDGKVRDALMHQAVVAYLANQRKGLASTKTKGEVKGSGRKPWRQKGTGRARFGTSRNPVWRGGGVAFGPKPHSYNKALPKKMKTQALKSALNVKLRDEEMIVLDAIAVDSPKTKEFVKISNDLKITGDKIRLVVEKLDKNLVLSLRNIAKTQIIEAANLNTYEALDCKKLIFTKEALANVTGRIKKCLE